MEHVTPREKQVLRLVAAGKSTKQIAAELGIAFKTAACHRYNLLGKFGAANTADLVCRALRTGLISKSETAGDSGPVETWILSVEQECRIQRQMLAKALEVSRTLQEQQQHIRDEVEAAVKGLLGNLRYRNRNGRDPKAAPHVPGSSANGTGLFESNSFTHCGR